MQNYHVSTLFHSNISYNSKPKFKNMFVFAKWKFCCHELAILYYTMLYQLGYCVSFSLLQVNSLKATEKIRQCSSYEKKKFPFNSKNLY